MSGHSKWHSIRHKKAATDAKRGKIFTRHANLITIAARSGGDPEMNPTLRLALENARKANLPSSNIDRAIKRGTGELKDAAAIEEVTYEGYGPNGIAVIVEALTDNKNRSYTNIRTAFNKNGGSLGESGSVMYMFERKGVITINAEGQDTDEIELTAIDAGAEDIKVDGDIVQIYTAPGSLNDVSEKLTAGGIEFENAESSMIPSNTVEISDEEAAKKVMAFIEAIEEDDDVSNVHSNFDIDDSILDQLA